MLVPGAGPTCLAPGEHHEPVNIVLTIGEAADLLEATAGDVVDMIEDGRLLYHYRGRDRRVMLRDVLDYRELRRCDREVDREAMCAHSDVCDVHHYFELTQGGR